MEMSRGGGQGGLYFISRQNLVKVITPPNKALALEFCLESLDPEVLVRVFVNLAHMVDGVDAKDCKRVGNCFSLKPPHQPFELIKLGVVKKRERAHIVSPYEADPAQEPSLRIASRASKKKN